jgi:hypothetical protein
MSSTPSAPKSSQSGVTIRALREQDLPAADRIIRLAFGTFLGLPVPSLFMGDADYVRTRWLADPSAAFAAELAGELVGTNFAGLFTFPASAKHVSLYQKFGFWPRFLTALMEQPVRSELKSVEWTRFSELSTDEKRSRLQSCCELTSSIYDGLDLEREIRAVDEQYLGDTVLTWTGSQLAGLAVCHAGPGTEAGSGKCYVKFGAVRCGPNAPREFRRLLEACYEFAAERGATTLDAGVNLARLDAYREMLQTGFRTTRQGVVMERNAEPGYNRPEVFLIDDWR